MLQSFGTVDIYDKISQNVPSNSKVGGIMQKYVGAIIAFSFVLSAAHGQEFPPVHVYAETDDEDTKNCQFSGASIVAAVKSELRHNQIPIASAEQYTSTKAIAAYVQTIALKLSDGTCVVAYGLNLKNAQTVVVDVTSEIRFAPVSFCDMEGLLSGPASGLQARLNDKFRDFTSQCISKYLED